MAGSVRFVPTALEAGNLGSDTPKWVTCTTTAPWTYPFRAQFTMLY
jgi:hypothetical protein